MSIEQVLMQLYNAEYNYPITDTIQQLDVDVDASRLQDELLNLIVDNHYGIDVVSLRLQAGDTNWINPIENLRATAVPSMSILKDDYRLPPNNISNEEYTEWHPDLENSYVKDLVPQIEKYTGARIGRIRLGWLMPNAGYPMHSDLEPLRLHIPLFTNSLASFIHDGTSSTMEYGKLHHLISTTTHTAHNFGKLPRLHLVFSTIATPAISSVISQVTDSRYTNKRFVDHLQDTGVTPESIEKLRKIIKDTDNEILDKADCYNLTIDDQFNKLINIIVDTKTA